ncbi:MAG: hypothetical protein ABJL67_23835 [Sulfitobacter sp.]
MRNFLAGLSGGSGAFAAAAVVVVLVAAGYWVQTERNASDLTELAVIDPGPSEAPKTVEQEDVSTPVDPLPETAEETGPAEPETPETDLVEAEPETEVPAPSFDEVRREADGVTVIAGRAAPGADIEVLQNGVVVSTLTADAAGKFATIALIPLDGQGHVLTLRQTFKGEARVSDDEILLAPLAAPVVVAEATPEAEPTPEPDLETAEAEPEADQSLAEAEVVQNDVTAAPLEAAVSDVQDEEIAQAPAVAAEQKEIVQSESAAPDAPVESVDAAVETADAPVESVDAPVETTDAPTETADVPVETVDAPNEIAEVPLETAEATEAVVGVAVDAAASVTETVQAEGSEPLAILDPIAPNPGKETLATDTVAEAPATEVGGNVAVTTVEDVVETDTAVIEAEAEAEVEVDTPTSAREAEVVVAEEIAPTVTSTSTVESVVASDGGDRGDEGDVVEQPQEIAALDPTPQQEPVVPAPATQTPLADTADQNVGAPPETTNNGGEDAVQAVSEPQAAPVQTATAPVLKSTAEGVELLNPAAPEVMSSVAIDTISYSDAGDVQLAGRAQSEASSVRVYLNNNSVVSLSVDTQGRWRGDLPNVDEGIYTLRVDEVTSSGEVTSRIETPFKRESPEVLTAAAAQVDGPIKAITVQKGATLWAIARERYGSGKLFVRVFEANKESIRDPDLIYPGQVFDLPD